MIELSIQCTQYQSTYIKSLTE